MNEYDLTERQLGSKLIFDGRILHVYDDAVELPNGQTASRELIRYECFGGVAGCERVMARFGNPEELGYETPFPITCVKISPLQQKFADELSHRDILGAVMNLGIERGCLGDIVLRDNVAYLFATERIAPFICENLTKVKHTSVKCEVTDAPPEGELFRTETMTVNVSSLRADCVVAAVWRLSRGSAEKLFAAQKVFVNGRLTESGSGQLKENDIVSVRGTGRFVYKAVSGNSKKGRLFIEIEKYV